MGIGDGDRDAWGTMEEMKIEVKMSMDEGWG